MPDFEIVEVTAPERIDGPDAADFIDVIELGNAVQAIGYGTPDLAYEPAEELPLSHNPHEPRRFLTLRVEGALAARGVYKTTTGEEADAAWLNVEVLPEFRGRGFGTALAEALESIAIDEGKSKALAYSPIRDAPGGRLTPPTGFGSVPSASRKVRFLRARGYSLEQVVRASRLALPVPGLGELVDAAQAATGTDYAVRTWRGRRRSTGERTSRCWRPG